MGDINLFHSFQYDSPGKQTQPEVQVCQDARQGQDSLLQEGPQGKNVH